MKLTKYSHACFTVEKDGRTIIVDPGVWSSDLELPSTVAAVIVTHEHPDHLDEKIIREIIAAHPKAELVAADSITNQFPDLSTRSVSAGETLSIGGFQLTFYGGEHAVIHSSYPRIVNLGVMIDKQVYYPGDSFAMPDTPVETLLLPISAPWLKVSEVFDFMTAIKPQHSIPTHDAILSDTGKALLDRMVGAHAQSLGGAYQRLDGQSIVLE